MEGQRIVFAVTNDLVYDRRMFRICTALAESGADVLLVGRRFKSSLNFHPGIFDTKRFRCIFNTGFLFYAEYNIRLFLFLLFTPFDIACACDLDTALAVRSAAAMKARKTVYDAHEYFTEVPELTGRSFVKKVWSIIGDLTIRGFDLRYTVGEELALIMGTKYASVFHVIRNIPSEAQVSQEAKKHRSTEKILLYQGALNAGRGLVQLLEAMTLLPEWQLWLAGEGDITGMLKSTTAQKDLNDRVTFLGWIYAHELPELMSKARLGVNLREAGSLNDYYSLPNKFFDCIHAGLPSINMNYPEYVRICERFPCAVLIDNVSAETIAHTVKSIDAQPELYAGMVNACLDAAMELSWIHESNKLVTLYNEVIAS